MGKENNPKRTFECVPCGKSYTTQPALSFHRHSFKSCPQYKPSKNGERKIIRKNKKFLCKGCSRHFASKQGLQNHQKKSKTNPKICQLESSPKHYYVIHQDDITYECDPCKKVYKSDSGLRYHRRVTKSCPHYKPAAAGNGNKNEESTSEAEKGPSTRSYRCDKCEKEYTRKETLMKHQSRPPCPYYKPELDKNGQVVPYEPKYKCETCQTRFSTPFTLQEHRKLNRCQKILEKRRLYTKYTTPEERLQLKCFTCDKKFQTKIRLLRHKIRNLCKRNVRLEEEFQSSSETKKIKWSRKPKQVYKCDQCPKYFSSKSAVARHKRATCPSNRVDADGKIIPLQKEYLCENCGQAYTTSTNFQRHKDNGTCERKLEQMEKDRMWRNQVNHPKVLETLSSINNSKALEWYKCDRCEQYFINNGYIRRHQRRACERYLALKSAGDFVCSFCNAVFKTAYSLQYHIVLKCIVAFRHESNLRRKPICCDLCDLRFAKKEILDYHHYHKICESNKETEELEKRHQCQKCHQRFSVKLSLTMHYRSRICQKFNLSETLQKIAKALAEPEKLTLQFNCRWCSAYFESQAEMVNHMQVVHKKKIPKDKLMTMDADNLQVDPLRPIIHTCYICLKRFPQVIGVALNIQSCERKIGVSSDGFVPTIDRLR